MIRFLLIFALMFSTLVTRRLPAAEAGEGNEAKLREVLRATTLQLRSAENERATLQSAQAALAEDKKTLEAKFETLRPRPHSQSRYSTPHPPHLHLHTLSTSGWTSSGSPASAP